MGRRVYGKKIQKNIMGNRYHICCVVLVTMQKSIVSIFSGKIIAGVVVVAVALWISIVES